MEPFQNPINLQGPGKPNAAEEPQFFVNEFLATSEGEIENIIKAINKKPEKYEERAVFLKKFANQMLRSYMRNKKIWKIQEKEKAKQEIIKEIDAIEAERISLENYIAQQEEKKEEMLRKRGLLKKELEKKKEEILKKLKEMPEEGAAPLVKPAEKPPIPIPVPLPHNIKGADNLTQEHEESAPSVISEEHEIGAPEMKILKDLVASRETKKILASSEFNGTNYIVKEPEINENDRVIIAEAKTKIDTTKLTDKTYLYPIIESLAKSKSIPYDIDYYDKIRYYLLKDMNDYGVISPLLKDKNISEIVCDEINKPLHIVYDGKHDILTNIQFNTIDELNNFILFLAKKTNQKIDNENPFLMAETNKLTIQATLGTEHAAPRFVIEKKIIISSNR